MVWDYFSGLQPSSKSSTFPVRMENSVPIVPQNQSAQSLQIQPSMLTQVRVERMEVNCSSIISAADLYGSALHTYACFDGRKGMTVWMDDKDVQLVLVLFSHFSVDGSL